MKVDTAIEILTVRRTCMECVMGNGSCEDCDHAFDMAIKLLEERKTGKWVLVEMGDTNLYECSLCRNRKTYTPPFCEICGAKMEGAE